jgi:hypothetical protein
MDIIDYNNVSDDESVSSAEEIYNDFKNKFTIKDYLNCKSTKNALEKEHLEHFFETAEKDINALYLKIHKYCEINNTSILRFDPNYSCKALIAGLVYKHIQKKYNLNIFENNPELIQPLIAKYKEKKNTH